MSKDIVIQEVEKGQLKTELLHGFFVGWPNPPSSEALVRILENSFCAYVAIESQSGKVIGFINSLSDGVLSCYIPLLEVLPEYQGQGIGAKLTDTLIHKINKFYMIDVCCDEDVVPFYKKRGFMQGNSMVLRNYKSQSGVNLKSSL